MFGIENLLVWREALALAVRIEEAAQQVRGITAANASSQLIRAADSIVANIAEGYGRGVSRDGLRFFRMAKSSADEVESHLRRSVASGRLPPSVVDPGVSHTIRVRFLILRYAASIERRLKNRPDPSPS